MFEYDIESFRRMIAEKFSPTIISRMRFIAASARERNHVVIPKGYRPVLFAEFVIELMDRGEAATVISMIDNVVSLTGKSPEESYQRFAALESQGLITFAFSPNGNQPGVFMGAERRFDGAEYPMTDYAIACALVGAFAVSGKYDETVGDLPLASVDEWSAQSQSPLKQIAQYAGLSVRVVIETLRRFEANGWTNIRNAEKAKDGGYYVHLTIPDAQELTRSERAVCEAFRSMYLYEDKSRIPNLLQPSVVYATAEYMRAIEEQMAALQMAEFALTIDHKQKGVFDQFEPSALRAGETYCWFKDPQIAVLAAAATLPDTARCARELTDGTAGWWYFVDPAPVQTTEHDDTIRAMLWQWLNVPVETEFGPVDRPTLVIEAYVDDRQNRGCSIPSTRFQWREGLTLAQMQIESRRDFRQQYADHPALQFEDMHVNAAEYMARFFAAACMWMRQRVPVIVAEKTPIERHARKRLNREHQTDKTHVRIVQLRRRQSVSDKTPGSSKTVDWKNRWNVIGHWRKHPYRAGESIWIDDYMKGPEDKPIKVRPRTVYAVKR